MQHVAVDAGAVRADDDVVAGYRGGLAEVVVRLAIIGDEFGDLIPDAAGFGEHIRGALIRVTADRGAKRADDRGVAVDHDRGAERRAVVGHAVVGHEFLPFGPDASGLRENVDRAFPAVDVDGADQRGRAADRDGLTERVVRHAVVGCDFLFGPRERADGRRRDVRVRDGQEDGRSRFGTSADQRA